MFKNIFFIGIGGKGLNGIAKICLQKGYNVSGVDRKESPETIDLTRSGAKIYYKHTSKNINHKTDLVVYSSIAKNTPEIKYADRHNIPTLKRSEFLNFLTQGNFRISVCGSHGKSTTTALLGLSTIASGVDSSIFGGAYTKELHGYNHLGKTNYTIIEACEYDRSFHDLIGDISIITSAEKSHLEYYEDEAEMLESFNFFVNNHHRKATIIANGDDINVRMVTTGAKCKVIYFGFNEINDYIIKDLKKTTNGSTFSLYKRGDHQKEEPVVRNLKINIPGNYNVLNFAACAIFMKEMNFAMAGLIETARTFTGVGRRFEIFSAENGKIFVDDFAHHPTQVKNLFDGIKQYYPNKKICAVFQPRQYNLIRNFLKEYGKSFRQSDEVIVMDLVPALGDTEKDIKSLKTSDVAKSIMTNSFKPARQMNNLNEIAKYIDEKYKKDCVITTIGAGDVYKVRDIMNAK